MLGNQKKPSHKKNVLSDMNSSFQLRDSTAFNAHSVFASFDFETAINSEIVAPTVLT